MKKQILFCCLAMFLSGCIGRKVVYDKENPPENQINSRINVSSSYKSFIIRHNPKIDKALAAEMAYYISYYSKLNELDPKLVLGLIAKESSFRSGVISHHGAIGLGQLKSDTARDMGITNPFDPQENIRGTTRYLSLLLKTWKGNVDLALASYKAGIGTIRNLITNKREISGETKKYINDIKSLQANISDSFD